MSLDYDYRGDYYKHHKGLFGIGIYFCSYCGRPITRRGVKVFGIKILRSANIDHIAPKSKNQAVFNASWNTTIACEKCNKRKSDKVNARYLAQGYTSKVLGAGVGTAMGVGMAGTGAAIKGTSKVVQGTAKVAGWGAEKVAKGTLWSVKMVLEGFWWTIKEIIGSIFSLLFKNIAITAIVIAVIYFKFM